MTMECEYDPVLGDTYGYPKIEYWGGWFRYCVGWALLGLDEDEPAMYFDYYISENRFYLHLNMVYFDYYLEGDKITICFPYYPYSEVFESGEEE